MKKIFILLFLLFPAIPTQVSAQSCPTPPTNTGQVTLSTTITQGGTYRVWSRMKAADTTNNSFYLKIDNNCPILVGNLSQIPQGTWTWVDYQNGSTSNKINTTLTPGNHVITLIGNEAGVSVDKILLTQNLTCVPQDMGNNCPAVTATPSPTKTPTPTSVITKTPTPTSVITKTPTPTSVITKTPTTIITQSPPTTTTVKTPTPTSSGTNIRFDSIKLHGIGQSGDNANPNGRGNQNPLTREKKITVEIYNSNGNKVFSDSSSASYRPSSGDFSTSITLSSNVTPGIYIVKIKTDKYLSEQVPGVIQIGSGSTSVIPQVTLITGDVNNDNSLNLLDYNLIIGCYSDFLPAKNCDSTKKKATDLSDDGKVDQDDLNLFIREISVRQGE